MCVARLHVPVTLSSLFWKLIDESKIMIIKTDPQRFYVEIKKNDYSLFFVLPDQVHKVVSPDVLDVNQKFIDILKLTPPESRWALFADAEYLNSVMSGL